MLLLLSLLVCFLFFSLYLSIDDGDTNKQKTTTIKKNEDAISI